MASDPAAQIYPHAADILERMAEAFVALDSDWHIVYANHEACRINQKPLEAFQGKLHWDEWPASVGTELERQFRFVMTERVAAHFEHRYVIDPYDVWLEIDVFPSEGGGINLFYRDISERKAAEQVLRQFQFLSDHAGDAFFLLDAQGRFVYVNHTACRSLGYTAAQFPEMRAQDIDPFYDDVHYEALFLRAEGERLPPFEAEQKRADGSTFPIEASVSRLNVGGKALLFSSCRDISERKSAEQELRQAALRQRAFLRDVLASVTDGHLILCDTPADLPPRLPPFGGPVFLSMSGGLRELRQVIRAACQRVGLSEEREFDLVTAASEAGMNTVVHVGSGEGQVFTDEDIVQVRVVDHGSGIAVESLPHATLKKGYSSAGTLGHGMKMMLQTADRVFLLTGTDGTTIVLEQDRLVPVTAL